MDIKNDINYETPNYATSLRVILVAYDFFVDNNLIITRENRLRGRAVGWGTMLQAGRPRVRFPMRSLDFSSDIILPAAL
jgi:hypothetical protein